MQRRKICFIAQFPPPIHGLSKAVDTLYNSKISQQFDLEKVNITNNRYFFKNVFLLLKSNADLFYFTISQSRWGNVRDLLILKLLEIRHKRCVIHLHGGYYRILVDKILPKWQRKANYKAIEKLDGAIVLSHSLKYIFEGMIAEEKIHIISNCVDDEYLMTDEKFKEKLSAADKKKIKHVLYLSNFIPSKGYREVLKMAVLEKNDYQLKHKRKIHFDFAGKFFNNKEKKFFFNFIERNELENYVTYHGIVNNDRKKVLLNECDIFVLLTRYPIEGQPISILEAMGNGMTVVTTDHAGIPDMIKDGINGILITEKNNVADLAYQKIITMDLKPLATNGRMDVLQKFTQKKYIDAIEKLFYDKMY